LKANVVVALVLAVNAVLCAAHFVVYWTSGSQLVLAQGADSLMDLAVGTVLLVSVRVAAQPRDANHPFGHERAEPIGALVTSVLAFVLAIEVVRSAITKLVVAEPAVADGAVLAVLGAKCAVKSLLLLAFEWQRRARRSQAVAATRLDTLNDVITTASSLVGAMLVRHGWPVWDALLALPVGVYLGRNGWQLCRESLRYLMGEAPPKPVLDRLHAAAAAVEGVREVSKIRAHFVGSVLHVEVTVLVAATSSAKQAHDVALDVQAAVEKDALVGEVFVHIDTGEGKDGT
jgi:cation diffusion facilitator family transporter